MCIRDSYTAFRDNAIVSMVLRGMQAGVTAVIANVVISMAWDILKEKRILPVLMMVGAFLLSVLANVNVLVILLACGVIGAVDKMCIRDRRIAVAISLANRPKLLLADEPTGSVDAKTGAYILDMLRAINRDTGVTIVIVTHDPLLAKKVNRVVAIRDGKISSERIMKQSYLERLHDINAFTDAKEVQDEYAVLDRAGRLQIPRDMLDKLQITGNRMKMELREDKIILEKPEEVAEP